jgi:diacylglycerol kinase (ATP)
MSNRIPRRLVLAVNPRASFGKNKKAGGFITQALRAAGYEVVVCQAQNYQALLEQVREALTIPAHALVLVGGDGMVHLGVQIASETGVALGMVPSGTGNDVARHLEIPLSVEGGLSHLLEALELPPRHIDQGLSNGPDGSVIPFLCVLSAGFDASVNERANRLRFSHGRHRYTLALLIELVMFRTRRYQVEIDGQDFSGEYLLVAVANARGFGGGMKVAPDAVIDDGLFDVVLIKPLSRLALLAIYPRVFTGTHVTDPRVVLHRGAEVLVATEGIVAYADGEPMTAMPIRAVLAPRSVAVYA